MASTPNATTPPDSPRLFTRQFWLLCLSSVMFMASFNMIIPELPQFLTDLGGSEYLGLNIFLFALMALISRPFSGRLVDTIGRVPIMIFGALMSSICGLFYPFVTSIAAYFVLRTVHGTATGFKPTGTTAFLADVVPAGRRGEALGYLGISGSLGMSGGPALGAWIAVQFSQEAMFYLSSAMALASVIVVLGMKETLPNPQRFRLGLLKVNRHQVFEPRVLAVAMIMMLLCFAFGTVLTITPDLSDHLGLENRGTFMTVFVLCSLLMRVVAGAVSDRYGREPVLKVGILLLIAGMVVTGMATTKTMFLVGAALYGMSVGVNAPTLFAWTVDLAHDDERGKAMGTLYIGLELGIGLGALFSAYIYNNDPAMFMPTFWFCGAMGVVALAYLMAIRRLPGAFSLPKDAQ